MTNRNRSWGAMVTVARALALGAVVACASDSSPEVPIETAPSAEPDEELGQSTEPILIYNYSDSDGDSAATGGCLTRWNGGTSCTVANPPGAHWARDACASRLSIEPVPRNASGATGARVCSRARLLGAVRLRSATSRARSSSYSGTTPMLVVTQTERKTRRPSV